MKVFVTGDTHSDVLGRLNTVSFPEGLIAGSDTVVIILGDFGVLWENTVTEEEKKEIEFISNLPYTVCFLDGNHDNFYRINNLVEVDFCGGKAGKVSDNLYHLKRGEVYTFGDRKFLTIGGALSIDQWHRTEGISYWKEELLTREDTDNCIRNLMKPEVDYQVDFVLSHTLPLRSQKELCSQLGFEMIKDPTADFLDEMYNRVAFKHWYCGHWHMNRILTGMTVTTLYELILEI
jgi:hypothetical protein